MPSLPYVKHEMLQVLFLFNIPLQHMPFFFPSSAWHKPILVLWATINAPDLFTQSYSLFPLLYLHIQLTSCSPFLSSSAWEDLPANNWKVASLSCLIHKVSKLFTITRQAGGCNGSESCCPHNSTKLLAWFCCFHMLYHLVDTGQLSKPT